jgi:hypothetical protein
MSQIPSSQQALASVTRRPAATSIINVASDLDKADIVAIAAVKFEEQLEAAKGRLNRRLADVNARIAEGEKSLKKACEELVRAHDISDEQKIAKSLKDAGFGSFEAAASLETIDENRQQVTLRVTINAKGSSPRGSYYDHTLQKEDKVAFSPEAKEVLKGLRANRQAVAEVNKQLAEVHKKLASIPALERKARARLAENALAGSEEGRKILEQLMSVTDGSLPQFMLTDGR